MTVKQARAIVKEDQEAKAITSSSGKTTTAQDNFDVPSVTVDS